MHAADALHGDLGMIATGDVVMCVSRSGETSELLRLLPYLSSRKIPLIALVGTANSALARQADVSLEVAVAREACPLGLAPTTSSLAAMAMGNALASALSALRSRARC
jgi:arabinose-5-phosphate isomerase